MGEIAKSVQPSEIQAAQEPDAIMAVISRAASDPATDVDKLERLMAMYERLEARKSEAAFNAAMTAAQKEIGRVAADATNPQTRSKYATYAALDRAVRPVYTDHGFALSFDTGADAPELHVRVLCYVSHEAGHCKTYRVDMPSDGKGAKGNDVMTRTHAAGSAMSYGMRYLLKAIFNIAIGEDDDDGNAAGRALPRITAEQAANIHALMEEVQANTSAFMRYWKIDSVEDIPAQAYKDVVASLERKRKK